MKSYRITVNGTPYAVEVEELNSGQRAPAPDPVPAAPVVQTAVSPVPAAPAAEMPPVSAAGETVTAPMPGTILSVNVVSGQTVKVGDTLLVLEAMKMENEIPAPAAGTIDSIAVEKGASVNAGDLLVTFR